MNTLYLCGAGNSEGVRLAMVINAREHRWDRIVLLDDDPALTGKDRIGVPIVGPFDALADADPDHDEVANLVARTTRGRWKARARIASFGVPFASLVHPDVDTFGAELAADAIVYNNATIGPEVVLGRGCVVFMGAVVGHECRVADGCVMAANSVLNARVELGERVYVGTNATVIPEVKLGADSTLAAGSVLLFDIAPDSTAVGVPAQVVTAGDTAPLASTQVADAVRHAWQVALGRDDVEADANFFTAGGDSLAAMRVCNELRSHDGIEVSVVEFFRFPTISALAAHLGGDVELEAGAGRDRARMRRAARARRHAAPGH